MSIVIGPRSHIDHGLTPAALDWIVEQFRDRTAFFAVTVDIPADWPDLECGLHSDVPDSEAFFARRGNRAGESRLCLRLPTRTRRLTVIAGPNREHAAGCGTVVLYTAFGGEIAPKEPWDTSLTPAERAESTAFWSTHALSATPDEARAAGRSR